MTGFDAVPADARGALVAAAVALGALAVARVAGWPLLRGLAGALGLAAGFVAVTGVVGASPRQLAERLPMLGLGALGVAALGSLPWRWLRWPAASAGVVAAAWWMAGAPSHPDTLLRAAPVGIGLAAAMGLVVWRGGGAAMAVAWAALAAGLALAAARGPHLAFALAGLAAVVGAAAGQGRGLVASRWCFGIALAAVAAVPVLGRAAPADWAAAAAPGLALLAGPWIGARLPRRIGPLLGPALAAAPALAAVLLLR
ncbi:hypothetical protein [Roseomonas sp. CECT 9278]|uniref:hypothetical protein n=1 Tax=Roseomonas sp. CECT 9278 TaxID=2845823 RepID=UPI001E4E2158|nr:hypothetical protein [Roseomonas sp. CECT 9278]CAH0309713.1 hypothetical protein ROS9278_04880 [Roseomonas sp. CECT 9278]